MQTFQYLLPLVSVLVGLALADLVMSIHRLAMARSRVRWHWHCPALALIVVLILLDIWWGLHPLQRANINWTIGLFVPLLGSFVLAFLVAAAALPDDAANETVDLRSHYLDQRGYIWTLLAALFVLLGLHTALVQTIISIDTNPAAIALGLADNLLVAGVALFLSRTKRAACHSSGLVLLLAIQIWSYAGKSLP